MDDRCSARSNWRDAPAPPCGARTMYDARPAPVTDYIPLHRMTVPLRRISRLHPSAAALVCAVVAACHTSRSGPPTADFLLFTAEDRKSTRLNSSHMSISYAVFCYKNKKTDNVQ